MKLFILLAIVILTDAMEISEDDVNSPLISYLLAKVQRLESKMMMARPAVVRKTRQTTDKPTKPPAIDSKQCTCQPGVVTYVRWGSSTCPDGANTIYSGVVAGSWYASEGAAVDPLCIPPDQQYLKYRPGNQLYARLYGAEYQTGGGPLDHSDERNVPCALCEVSGRTNKIMIPSRYQCPSGWVTEYYGYLMAGHYSQKAATQFTCIDKSLEQIPGSGANTNGYLFYPVEGVCGHYIPCTEKEYTCAVCTK